MNKWICGVLAGAMCFGGMTAFGDASNVPVYIDESLVQTEQPGVIIGDVTMIPVRIIAEQLGCTVVWNEENQAVAVTNSDTGLYFAMYVGRTEVFDGNGTRYEMPAAPRLMYDRNGVEHTMVPVRFVSDMLGKQVEWDDVTETVFIDSPQAYANVGNTPGYRKEWFGKEIRKMRNFAEQGMFYEAEGVRSQISIELLTEAKEIAPDYLTEYFVEADTISKNLQLMERGEPNLIEQEIMATQEKINRARDYFNQEMYYEAGNALSDIGNYRRTPEQDNEISQLQVAIKEGIKNIPNLEMEGIRRLLKDKMYYEAYAGIENVLAQELTAEQRTTAARLKEDIEDALDAYEKSLKVANILYVTNVAHAVNFRSSAKTGDNLIATIPYGSPVGYISTASNGYYKVESNGKYGYIASQFLTEEKPPTSVSGTRYVVCREPIALLGQPSTVDGVQIIRWIDYKEPMSFIANVNSQFARVKYDGDYGYVERQYLSNEKP